jgi:phosphoribosyl-ATP pyrophosphohydrolase/phosphoribosyl-AMP cyclohydrolase
MAEKGMQAGSEILEEVFTVIRDRRDNPKPESYVSGLMGKGLKSILAKISEEAEELVEAAEIKNENEIVHESADLIFHILVLLGYKKIELAKVFEELKHRRKVKKK